MAYVDYRLCDICDAKTFYDANLTYDFEEHGETGLCNLGAWKVICKECAKTHELVIVSRTPKSPTERIAELERLVADLQRITVELRDRIVALEARAASAGTRQLEPLRQHNASRRAGAERLRIEITKLLDGHPIADELTGRQIREALKCAGYSPLPAERTVRLHLAQIRGNGNTGCIAGSHILTSYQEL